MRLEEKGAVPVVARDSRDFPTEIDQKRATVSTVGCCYTTGRAGGSELVGLVTRTSSSAAAAAGERD